MSKIKANNIEIEYDTFGDPSNEPLLLIMGLGTQMVAWEPEFCQKLVNKGFYVIRFDNRDVGLSTKFEEAGVPNIMQLILTAQRGEKIEAPYTLDDMADDAAGLLKALGFEKAHVCGASMGAMITQVLAIRHPEKVLSITSIMGSTGNPELPHARPEAMQVLLKPAPTDRDAYIEDSIRRRRILYGSGFPFDEEKARKLAELSYDRCFNPQGIMRQMAAILAAGNRKSMLSRIKCPTLVIHGGDDPLVPVEGGKDTAESIEEAELLIIEGMGHSLPVECWDQIVEAIAKNAAKARK
ncbi:MAG: alpha/beta fold hydrolase [Promethearchaeota archaeon]